MPSLILHRSNRLEILAEQLAMIQATPGDPMEPQTIVVQSAGMQRWISMRLADQHGICAHLNFPFPVAFAHDLCLRLCPDQPKAYPMSQERMLWYIARHIKTFRHDPDFGPLHKYLEEDSPLKIVQLAERIAYHFDQYLIFRPTWAQAWEQGTLSGDFEHATTLAHEAWQSKIWRKLVSHMGSVHRAALLDRAITILAHDHVQENLPTRVCVFGIPTLPPIYLQLLQALSAHIPIHIFLLSPCREYWGDLVTHKKKQQHYRQQNLSLGEYPEDNNPLADLGTVGQDFLELLLEHELREIESYAEPDSGTLLGQLQKDLLDLTVHPDPLPFTDRSIQVHCCHSPWREMEVLKDLILDLLASDDTLTPRDILIMNPDIDAYAPIIQAVFGPHDAQYIPFSIADRKPTKALETIRLFLELLDFGLHRFEASRVSALLEAAPIRQNLDVDAAQTRQILGWISAANIRWGLDAAFRKNMGLGEHGQNTWTSGLSRLFLGYMMGDSTPIHDLAPLPLTSTSEQELLGKLATWIDHLGSLWAKVHQARSALEWRETLLWVVDTFFPQNHALAEGLLTLRRTITELTDYMDDFAVDLRTMRYLMHQRLAETSGESGFLTSGLTFCGLLPMRSIPFRVIVLTGLTSTAFPRQHTPPSFDLLASRSRRGDRNTREDDRYLFLESIISARDQLILTYPGLSQKDNSEAPPSVLVSELLDFLDNNYRVHEHLPSATLTFHHKLQAFHPEYFTPDSNLFSYSRQNRDAAQTLSQDQASQPFFSPASRQEQKNLDQQAQVSLDALIRFFTHPCRYLLSSRQILPASKAHSLPDEEPLVEPTGLEAYDSLQKLLTANLTQPQSNVHNLLLSWQILPPGQAGQDVSNKLDQEIHTLARQIRYITQDAQPEPYAIDLSLGTFQLKGHVPLYGSQLITYRMAKTKAKDMLSLWILYLATLISGQTPQARHIGKDQVLTLSPPANPDLLLTTLLHFYAHGLVQPLPFFPRTSLAFAQARFTGRYPKDRDTALHHAMKNWVGDAYSLSPEKEDPYLSFLFQDQDPDWDDFMHVAEAVYQPILENQS